MGLKGTGDGSVVVTGCGMVASLGHDAATCAAAYRAGLSGAREYDDFLVFNPQDNMHAKIHTHSVPSLTAGFEGMGRLVRLGWGGLRDLLAQDDIRQTNPQRTGVILALRDYRRPQENIPGSSAYMARDDDSMIKGSVHDRRRFVEELGRALFQKLVTLVEWNAPPVNVEIVEAAHAGIATSIQRAISRIDNGLVDRCLIGGIDTFLNRESLEWLADNQLIKTEDLAVGIQPGEAGVFLVVEKMQSSINRKASLRGVIGTVSVGFEEKHHFQEEPCLGQGLASVALAAGASANDAGRGLAWLISDQNGEVYRSSEWGHALVRLIPTCPSLSNAVIWMPSLSFGDTGAASGGVGLVLALRAFQRNLHVANKALILSSSPWGERAALSIQSV